MICTDSRGIGYDNTSKFITLDDGAVFQVLIYGEDGELVVDDNGNPVCDMEKASEAAIAFQEGR